MKVRQEKPDNLLPSGRAKELERCYKRAYKAFFRAENKRSWMTLKQMQILSEVSKDIAQIPRDATNYFSKVQEYRNALTRRIQPKTLSKQYDRSVGERKIDPMRFRLAVVVTMIGAAVLNAWDRNKSLLNKRSGQIMLAVMAIGMLLEYCASKLLLWYKKWEHNQLLSSRAKRKAQEEIAMITTIKEAKSKKVPVYAAASLLKDGLIAMSEEEARLLLRTLKDIHKHLAQYEVYVDKTTPPKVPYSKTELKAQKRFLMDFWTPKMHNDQKELTEAVWGKIYSGLRGNEDALLEIYEFCTATDVDHLDRSLSEELEAKQNKTRSVHPKVIRTRTTGHGSSDQSKLEHELGFDDLLQLPSKILQQVQITTTPHQHASDANHLMRPVRTRGRKRRKDKKQHAAIGQ